MIDRLIVFLSMVFLHILDDFTLQGILADMKQRSWWEKNAPDSMYSLDYIMALLEHSFSWSFMIHIPIVAYSMLCGAQLNTIFFAAVFVVNVGVHAVVDHLKANIHSISLYQDQIVHLEQIVATFFLLMP